MQKTAALPHMQKKTAALPHMQKKTAKRTFDGAEPDAKITKISKPGPDVAKSDHTTPSNATAWNKLMSLIKHELDKHDEASILTWVGLLGGDGLCNIDAIFDSSNPGCISFDELKAFLNNDIARMAFRTVVASLSVLHTHGLLSKDPKPRKDLADHIVRLFEREYVVQGHTSSAPRFRAL